MTAAAAATDADKDAIDDCRPSEVLDTTGTATDNSDVRRLSEVGGVTAAAATDCDKDAIDGCRPSGVVDATTSDDVQQPSDVEDTTTNTAGDTSDVRRPSEVERVMAVATTNIGMDANDVCWPREVVGTTMDEARDDVRQPSEVGRGMAGATANVDTDATATTGDDEATGEPSPTLHLLP